MALPDYLLTCCLFLVFPSPNSALRVLVGSIGSAIVDSTYSNNLADEAHGDRELIGLLKEPEFIKPRTNQDLDIDKAHRKAITKPVWGVSNDVVRLEPQSFVVSDSEFIDPPANLDADIDNAHIKHMPKSGLSLSDNEAHVDPKSFTISDSEFIRPPNNPHSDNDKTNIKPTTRPSLSISNGKAHVESKRFSGVDNEFLAPPTNPGFIVKKFHIEPTTMPVLSIFDKTHRKPIILANGAHEFSGVTIIARNRHVSLAKIGDTNFAVTKDGNDGPFLPSPDCCYLKNALDANNKSPEQLTTLVNKNRVR